MKKKIILLLLCMILTFATSNVAFTSEKKVNDYQTLFKQTEVTDISILWDRANKGEGDIEPKGSLTNSKLTNAPQNIIVDTKSTTQKLKQIKHLNGIIQTSYATTVFDTIVDTDESAVPLSADSWDRWDGSYSFNHVSTYYYNIFVENNYTWVQPSQMVSRWYKSGNDVSLVDAKTGFYWQGYNGVNQVSGEKYVWPLNEYNISYGSPYWTSVSPSEIGGREYIRCAAVGERVVFEQVSILKRVNTTDTWTFTSNKVFALQ